MQSASPSVAALASALAKAQLELVNPGKSSVGTVPSTRGDQAEQTFRYASLASGLDVIRKTLGKYELAVVQTTAVDSATGIVNLTTVLAHGSGEWVSSQWPVCPAADVVMPRRMGAALTYARRYALFTLVGIAGEDDLDTPVNTPEFTENVTKTPSSPVASSFTQAKPEHRSARGRARPVAAILDASHSAESRERLLVEIAALDTREAATAWARAVLALKNTLRTDDALALQQAFAARLQMINRPPSGTDAVANSAEEPLLASAAAEHSHLRGIDKSALAIGEPRRIRSKAHLKFVASQPCLVCGRQPADAHHLRFAQPRAMARKVSDEFTVPLCRSHHRQLHRRGNERDWWSSIGIDPLPVASGLWSRTRGSESAQSAVPD